jgi:hypothetical protein
MEGFKIEVGHVYSINFEGFYQARYIKITSSVFIFVKSHMVDLRIIHINIISKMIIGKAFLTLAVKENKILFLAPLALDLVNLKSVLCNHTFVFMVKDSITIKTKLYILKWNWYID